MFDWIDLGIAFLCGAIAGILAVVHIYGTGVPPDDPLGPA